MVQVCFVSGCDHRGGRESCHFYRFPRDKRKRWGDLSRRTDRLPHTENDRICSCHFIGGDKTKDPVLFPYNEEKCFNSPDPEVRFQRTMVKHCCIVGCEMESSDFSRALGISFYCFPSNKLQRQAWIMTIGRTMDWKPSSCDLICSCHFAYGRKSNNPADLNYRPTLFLGSDDVARSHRSAATSSNICPNEDVCSKPPTLMNVKVISAEVEERDENVCRHSQEKLPPEAHIESNQIVENYSVQELARALYQFQQTGYLCDTLLVAEDGQLKAHSAVLAAASPLLKSSLKMISPISHVIILPGIKLFVLEVIVHFIYTGDVMIPAKYSADKDVSALVLATMLELGLKVAASHSRNITVFADSKDNRTVIIRGNTTVTAPLNASNNSGNSLSPGKQTSSSIGQEQDLDFEHVNTTVPAATKPSSSTESIRRAAAPSVHLPTPGVSLLKAPSRLSKQPPSADHNLANTSDVNNAVKSVLPYSCLREYLTVVNSSGRIVVMESRVPKKLRKDNCIPGKQLCEYCGKLIQSHKMLVNHLTTHTGNLQFACKQCDKSFAHELRLKQHMFTHTGKRTFTCQACHAVFTDVEKFREHKRIAHRGMRLGGAKKKRKECVVCGRTFSSNWHLNLHVRSHTGEKPFRCTVCPRKFVMKQGLQWHMRQHTGETPYLCQECGCSFSQPSSYYGHMIKYHGYKKKPRLSESGAWRR